MVNLLRTIDPAGLYPISADGEWEEIELFVDGGATETVISQEMLSRVALKGGLAKKRGVEYETANGVKIPNLGEKTFTGVMDDGASRSITAQVCEVNEGLLSVKKMTQADSRVVFDTEGSFIEGKNTGEKIWMEDAGGMYALKMWVKAIFRKLLKCRKTKAKI